MKKTFKKIINKVIMCVLWLLPKTIAHKLLYYKRVHKKLNLKNPKDFNEKLQYLILYKHGEKEKECSDKYLVRENLKELGYEDLLPKLYGAYKTFDEINISELPEKFVLKTNNGSGTAFICLDKNNFDFNKCKKMLNKNLKRNFAKESLEYHYMNIKPLIICEEYIDDGNGKNPLDYKIHCFNGNPECILVCSERANGLKRDYYDLNWEYLNYTKEEYRNINSHKKPLNLEEMIKIARELSKGFPFVRVDLYNVNGKIYFGELTFTPNAGINKNLKQEALDYFGNLIEI